MTKLVALIDGSIYSHSVCDHAAWLAGRIGASVEILHVLGRRETDSTPVDMTGSLTLGARTTLLDELSKLDEQRARLAQQRGRAILDDARKRLKDDGIADVTARLMFGDLLDTLVDREADADMIVMGKRGEAADFAKLHLGSNLERVARAIRRPLFVVSRGFRPINRVLVAFDGGASSMRAVNELAGSRLVAQLPCMLLMAGPATSEARRQLDQAKSILQAAGLDVKADIVSGHAETAIAQAVAAQDIDLLVMGAYGHSRIRSLIIGSTTSEMLRSCRIPVMLYR